MKIIFLDIDGVMNSENHALEMHKLLESKKMTSKQYYDNWDLPYEGTILPLKKIVDETGAKIVLSSSWRYDINNITRLNKIFNPYGIEIIDRTTVDYITKTTLEKMGFDISNSYHSSNMCNGKPCELATSDRGAEIAYWLYTHEDIESFVILDDDWADIEPYYKEEHVQTNFYDWGLTFELANKAIKILNKEV